MMETTPKRNSVLSDELNTPPTHDDEISVGGLTDTFSGLDLAIALKRSASIMTVEGTPINDSKRFNFNATPAGKLVADNLLNFHLPSSFSSEYQPPTSATPQNQISKPQLVRVVVTPESDQHDTGDHQENALRTALLSGPEGCLRRDALKQYLHWSQTEQSAAAPISDLLR
jgi:hypothetical protein